MRYQIHTALLPRSGRAGGAGRARDAGSKPLDVARTIKEWRRRAGLSQTEVARRAGMLRPALARIEAGRVNPTMTTLERILGACGGSLMVERPADQGVDRAAIRRVLRITPLSRLGKTRILQLLAGRGVRFVIIGAAAARLHGDPIEPRVLEILLDPDPRNRPRLAAARKALSLPYVPLKPGELVVRSSPPYPLGSFAVLRRASWLIPLDRRDIPVAALDDLIRSAPDPRGAERLRAVREEASR